MHKQHDDNKNKKQVERKDIVQEAASTGTFEPEHLEAKHLLQRQSTLLVGTDGSNSEVAQFRTQQYAHCFDVDSGGGICILRDLHHRPVVAS